MFIFKPHLGKRQLEGTLSRGSLPTVASSILLRGRHYDPASLDFPVIELNQIETLSALLLDKWN